MTAATAAMSRAHAARAETRPISVLIADGEPLFRSGLAILMERERDMTVWGLAGDAEEALRLVSASNRPDVVVLDVRMQGSGLVRRLLEAAPGLRVLVLTSVATDAHVIAALQAGASGYVLKDADTNAVATAIRLVAGGKSVMSGPVADRMLGLITGERLRPGTDDGLTPREAQVLQMVASGVSYKQVALRLALSHNTVRGYVSRIYDKLSVGDRAQMVLYAVRKGLVEP
jgi:DNA-binding NarL/FixJ family response regulator